MRLLSVALLLVAAACVAPAGSFPCADSSQCTLDGVDGVCTADGWCAFPDGACPSGSRYGDAAGDGLAGTCIGAGYCGDGVVRPFVEDCDDGDPDGGDCPASCIRCDQGDESVENNGHCYTRFEAGQDWLGARDACVDLDAHLATLTSAAEDELVDGLVGTELRYWIGLDDDFTEGTFVWQDDRAFQFDDWSTSLSQPDGGTLESCGVIITTVDAWGDHECNSSGVPYVCEREPWTVDPASGHAYHYYGGGSVTSNDAAQAACASRGGGHLATIASADEQALVASLLGVRSAWIGLGDTQTEGEFVWSTGEPFDYDHWAPGEPSAGTPISDCVMMRADGGWDDLPCAELHAYVCELDG